LLLQSTAGQQPGRTSSFCPTSGANLLQSTAGLVPGRTRAVRWARRCSLRCNPLPGWCPAELLTGRQLSPCSGCCNPLPGWCPAEPGASRGLPMPSCCNPLPGWCPAELHHARSPSAPNQLQSTAGLVPGRTPSCEIPLGAQPVAIHCRAGVRQNVPGSTCHGCYALLQSTAGLVPGRTRRRRAAPAIHHRCNPLPGWCPAEPPGRPLLPRSRRCNPLPGWCPAEP